MPVHPSSVSYRENGKFRFWTERAMERIEFACRRRSSKDSYISPPGENIVTWIIQTPAMKQFSNLTDGIDWIQNLKIAG